MNPLIVIGIIIVLAGSLLAITGLKFVKWAGRAFDEADNNYCDPSKLTQQWERKMGNDGKWYWFPTDGKKISHTISKKVG
jgi:hypothetical protein